MSPHRARCLSLGLSLHGSHPLGDHPRAATAAEHHFRGLTKRGLGGDCQTPTNYHGLTGGGLTFNRSNRLTVQPLFDTSVSLGISAGSSDTDVTP